MGVGGREGFDTPLHHPENLPRKMVDLDIEVHRRRESRHYDQEQKGERNGQGDPDGGRGNFLSKSAYLNRGMNR